MQKENVFNRELMSMVTNFFSFSYKEITRNDDLGYDTYQKIYHKFEEILKEFYEKLSSQKNYKNRIRKFQNLYLEAKGPIPDLEKSDELIGINKWEVKTKMRVIDKLKFLLFDDIESITKIKNPNKYFDVYKFTKNTIFKNINKYEKEFRLRRNGLVHSRNIIGDNYKQQFYLKYPDIVNEYNDEGYLKKNKDDELIFVCNRKYLYLYLSYALKTLYMLLDKITPTDDRSELNKMLTVLSRFYIYLDDLDTTGDIFPIIQAWTNLLDYHETLHSDLLGKDNKILLSNICLILKKIDDKRYTSLITKYGNYIRASDFGKMTLHHIAGNDSETHELFQKMLNNNFFLL